MVGRVGRVGLGVLEVDLGPAVEVSDVDIAQHRTEVEGVTADGERVDVREERHRVERTVVLEASRTDTLHAGGDGDTLEMLVVDERTVLSRSDGVGQRDMAEAALAEGILVDDGEFFGQLHVCQTRAIAEGVLADTHYRVRHLHVVERRATVEGVVVDHLQRALAIPADELQRRALAEGRRVDAVHLERRTIESKPQQARTFLKCLAAYVEQLAAVLHAH